MVSTPVRRPCLIAHSSVSRTKVSSTLADVSPDPSINLLNGLMPLACGNTSVFSSNVSTVRCACCHLADSICTNASNLP